MSRLTRRSFVQTTLAAGAVLPFGAPAILSAGQSPNEKVRLAAVGVGGKGWTDIQGAAKFCEVVGYCDVAQSLGKRRGGFGQAAEAYPKAKGFSDWRRMLDELDCQVDAVTVSTPDHMHAPVTLTALRQGIACYTQKPLTRTVYEARVLTEAAAKAKVATQMGNQNHSGPGYRTLVQVVQGGLLGKIEAAHTWSDRPIWPQGIDRPKGSDPVPEGLAWDLWLGVAPERPFKADVYHPIKWRGWYDFGAGALGDMGCHIIDPVVWSLELGPPDTVLYEGPKPNVETFPENEVLTYQFPGTEHTAGESFTMKWYDGGRQPDVAVSPHLPKDLALPKNGVLMVGKEGTLVCPHGAMPQLYPQEKFANLESKFEPLAKWDHYGLWVDAIKTGETPNSNFAYAGPLTETVLLGVIASRVGNTQLEWNAKEMAFTNSDEANAFVRPEYRKGWQIEGLG
jgi:predicted dehydrogenase